MSYIVFTSLVVGKILGFVIGSTIATSLGLQPPRGVTPADVKMCGLIASTGLTVAIFMCGQAFPHYPRMQAHAKIGALLSIFSCVDIVSLSFALSSVVGGSLASKLTLIFTFAAPKVVGAGEPVGLNVGEGFG